MLQPSSGALLAGIAVVCFLLGAGLYHVCSLAVHGYRKLRQKYKDAYIDWPFVLLPIAVVGLAGFAVVMLIGAEANRSLTTKQLVAAAYECEQYGLRARVSKYTSDGKPKAVVCEAVPQHPQLKKSEFAI